MRRGFAAMAALCLVAGLGSARAASPSGFCDRTASFTAAQQDRALRFTARIQAELDATGERAALVSRSGLDLARFRIRYSHAAIAWRDDAGTWSARQLYYACDERRPRLYDQGLAGFALGIDDPDLAYVSIVRPRGAAAEALHRAALDSSRALRLVAARYSANAYPFSTRYQNCNQWVAELLAAEWGGLRDDDDALRRRAQAWLRDAGYGGEPVDVGPRILLVASLFVPFVHLDDHPPGERDALVLTISLPASLEALMRAREPDSERVELCHDAARIVVHRGWTPVADGCRPSEGDEVVAFGT